MGSSQSLVTKKKKPPVWVAKKTRQNAILQYNSQYSDLLQRNRVKLNGTIKLLRLWDHLRQLSVVDAIFEEEIKVFENIYLPC